MIPWRGLAVSVPAHAVLVVSPWPVALILTVTGIAAAMVLVYRHG